MPDAKQIRHALDVAVGDPLDEASSYAAVEHAKVLDVRLLTDLLKGLHGDPGPQLQHELLDAAPGADEQGVIHVHGDPHLVGFAVEDRWRSPACSETLLGQDARQVLGESGGSASEPVEGSPEPPDLRPVKPELQRRLNIHLVLHRRVHEGNAEVARARKEVEDGSHDQQDADRFWSRGARVHSVVDAAVPELPHHVAAADQSRLAAVAPAARPNLDSLRRAVDHLTDAELLHELELLLHALLDLIGVQRGAVILVELLALLGRRPLHRLMGVVVPQAVVHGEVQLVHV